MKTTIGFSHIGATHAAAAIAAYRDDQDRAHPIHKDQLESAIADLVTDLMHMACSRRIDFNIVLRMAMENIKKETST